MNPIAPRLVLTRPLAASQQFLDTLKSGFEGAIDAVICPLIAIVHGGTLPDMTPFRGLVFSSANGVSGYLALGGRTDLPAFCVGPATLQAARAAGMQASAAGGSLATLGDWLVAQRPLAPLLYLRGQHASGDLAARLTRNGIQTHEAVVYNQPFCPPAAPAVRMLGEERPVVVPLFSTRTAQAFAQIGPKSPLLVAAISEAVAKPVKGLHSLTVRVAARPQQTEMVALTDELLHEARRIEYA